MHFVGGNVVEKMLQAFVQLMGWAANREDNPAVRLPVRECAAR